MASPSRHLHSFLLLISFAIFYSSTDGDPSTSTSCPPFKCGSGFNLNYPFWQESKEFQLHCGYPGFNLSCDHQYPTIYLPHNNNFYQVQQIDYPSRSLTLAHALLAEPSCPRVLDVLGLATTSAGSTSLFSYTNGNKILHFYYDCSLSPPSLQDITCLGHGVMKSYVFVEGATPEFDWPKYCESVAVVPVIDKAIPDGNNNSILVGEFGKALQGGFKLTWKQPNGACQSCEASDGSCALGNYGQHFNFSCICSDGRQSIFNCHDYKEVAQVHNDPNRAEPNFVAFGAVILGGLVIAATVFYYVQKKRVGSYKPV